MNIKLKKLSLKNFKGVKELEINFGDVTEIRGANATGKTTIFDAFNWLLFGKDSKDRKDFNIKTLNEDGNELHGLEHSVTAVLEIDRKAITLTRTYKEKWTKTKGQADKELKGHTTDYIINEVPVSMKDYQSKINEIFNEDKFKLITNPLYFTNMNWKEQRKILLEVIGDIDDETVIFSNKELKPLEGLITDGIDNFNKATSARIKKLKDGIKSIPYRIDECNNSIVNEDFDEIEKEIEELAVEITEIDLMIADKSKANDKKLELQDELYKLKSEYRNKFTNAQNNLTDPKNELNSKLSELTQIRNSLQDKKSKLESNCREDTLSLNSYKKAAEKIEDELTILRGRFKEIKALSFNIDENNFICPTCKRELEQEDKEVEIIKMKENFERKKAANIQEVNQEGKLKKDRLQSLKSNIEGFTKDIEQYHQTISETQKEIDAINNEISKVKQAIDLAPEIIEVKFDGMEDLKNRMQAIEAEMRNFENNDNSSLLKQKRDLQLILDSNNRLLSKRDNNIELRKRIEELENEEKDLSIQIAKQEGLQYLGEQFVRTKVELLEESINKKFKGTVEFKLFQNQINGGLSETCEALIDGVPFSNANTAAQINAGLNIVNTMCEHFNAYAPVFVDNAESVNKIAKTESQLIKLTVSLDKKLVVEDK